MREVLIVVGVVVVTTGALCLWVWVLGRIEERDQRREAERARGTGPPDLDGGPRHIRRPTRGHARRPDHRGMDGA